MDTLPPELQMEIFSKLHDLDVLVSTQMAMPEYASTLAASVRELTTKDFTLVDPDYLAQYRHLAYTRNIGIVVEESSVHQLSHLRRLRRGNILVRKSLEYQPVLDKVFDALRVQKKTDDQYWRIQLGEGGPRVYIKNSVIVTPVPIIPPEGLTTLDLRGTVLPCPNLLRALLGYLPPVDRCAAEICIKYRLIPHGLRLSDLLQYAEKTLPAYERIVTKHMHEYVRASRVAYSDWYFKEASALSTFVEQTQHLFAMCEFFDPYTGGQPTKEEMRIVRGLRYG